MANRIISILRTPVSLSLSLFCERFAMPHRADGWWQRKCAYISIFFVNVAGRLFSAISNVQLEACKDRLISFVFQGGPTAVTSLTSSTYAQTTRYADRMIVIAAISFKEKSDATNFSRVTCSLLCSPCSRPLLIILTRSVLLIDDREVVSSLPFLVISRMRVARVSLSSVSFPCTFTDFCRERERERESLSLGRLGFAGMLSFHSRISRYDLSRSSLSVSPRRWMIVKRLRFIFIYFIYRSYMKRRLMRLIIV